MRQVGEHFILADAGGGTVDITTYQVTREFPLELKEAVVPDCKLTKPTDARDRCSSF